MSSEIRNINNGRTGNCPTPGALTPTDAQNVAVFTGDVYDDYFGENQAELNKRFAQGGDKCEDYPIGIYITSNSLKASQAKNIEHVIHTGKTLERDKTYMVFLHREGFYKSTCQIRTVNQLFKDWTESDFFYFDTNGANVNSEILIKTTTDDISVDGTILYYIYEVNSYMLACMNSTNLFVAERVDELNDSSKTIYFDNETSKRIIGTNRLAYYKRINFIIPYAVDYFNTTSNTRKFKCIFELRNDAGYVIKTYTVDSGEVIMFDSMVDQYKYYLTVQTADDQPFTGYVHVQLISPSIVNLVKDLYKELRDLRADFKQYVATHP